MSSCVEHPALLDVGKLEKSLQLRVSAVFCVMHVTLMGSAGHSSYSLLILAVCSSL